MATFEQQKNDYEREKLDLMEQCRKDQESSVSPNSIVNISPTHILISASKIRTRERKS